MKTQAFVVSGDYTHENIVFNVCQQSPLDPTHWTFFGSALEAHGCASSFK